MRAIVLASLLLCSLPAFAEQGRDTDAWHRVVGVLQYLEPDYPLAVETGSAFELAEQKSFAAEAVEALEARGPEAAPFVARMRTIREQVDAGAAPEEVTAACRQLAGDLGPAGAPMPFPP